ncbi:unnamed protein product, partial [marine sediment metagenome]
MKKIIAVLKGDACGPEVTEEGLKILRIISDYTELELEFQDTPA